MIIACPGQLSALQYDIMTLVMLRSLEALEGQSTIHLTCPQGQAMFHINSQGPLSEICIYEIIYFINAQ